MPRHVPLDAAAAAHGGKAATLGALRRAGLPVPDGFVVPASVPADVLPRVAAAGLAGLPGDVGAAVAVRSSAPDEDGPHASAAGQYDTVLGAAGAAQVAAAVLGCRASAAGPRATAYRVAAGDDDVPALAVLVQHLVDARAAGVLFTQTDGRTVVEASWGLGTSVVAGAVDPDRFTVARDRVVERRTGTKRTRVDRSPAGAGGTVRRDVATADRARPCLDDGEVLRVAALGALVADLRGGPQDVEWALDAAGVLWLLQARPVTATLPRTRCGYAEARESAANTDHLRTRNLAGVPASGGRARGPARVVRGPADVARVRPGDVLVCRETDPAWTPLFGVAAAVVTETGGLLSHAAIVARELRLPAVLGVPGATSAGLDGTLVDVDGDAGTVTSVPPDAHAG